MRQLLFLYRKLRLLVKARLLLPRHVKIVSSGSTAVIETSNWPTANVVLWLKERGEIDRHSCIHYEPQETSICSFEGVRTFWDIGAHIGYYSILAALNGVPHILAVDIDDNYCSEVRKHAHANSLNISVIQAAIGEGGTPLTFANYAQDNVLTATSLDTLSQTYGIPDLIKVDIDGGEVSLLRSGKKLLSSQPAPRLLIEMVENIELITEILTEYGYKLVTKAGNNALWSK